MEAHCSFFFGVRKIHETSFISWTTSLDDNMAASTIFKKEIAYLIDDPLFASFLGLNKTDSDRIASVASLLRHTVAQSATPYLSEGQ
jgi:hypothetical protein